MASTPESRRAASAKYNSSEKRKLTRRKYNQSEKGRTYNYAQTRKWRAENRGKVLLSYRKHDLKRHYDMTVEQWNDLFTDQGYCCAACRSPDPRRKSGHWSTDHCHETGRVRGILCNHCNTALGHARDNPATLRALADYLERG